ncbi:MAG: GNAT family N-acetyltransferase [Caulobacter sp.]
MASSPASTDLAAPAAGPFPPPGFAPANWRAKGLSLRSIRFEDAFFLRDLYADLRAEELAAVDWLPAQKRAFTDSQYDLQDAHFGRAHPHAWRLIVERRGKPVGRLYLDDAAEGLLVVDIGLLAPARGKGIGADLLKAAQAHARRQGLPGVWLHVLKDNLRARSLYERLGFATTGETPTHWRMDWTA